MVVIFKSINVSYSQRDSGDLPQSLNYTFCTVDSMGNSLTSPLPQNTGNTIKPDDPYSAGHLLSHVPLKLQSR